MMGRQHATCGLLAGVGFAAAVPSAPLAVRGLLVIVTGGAALLPDLDHPQATAARSLGFVTKGIARGVDKVSLAIYHATRTPGDVADRHSGHRLVTHTVPGCLLAGLVVGVLALVSSVALAAVAGLLAGLLALGFKQAGFGLAVSTAGVSWWLFDHYPGWSLAVPVAVTVGCLIHTAGDWVTNSGVPVLWPLVSEGKRWRLVHAPVTFAAGDHVETMLVAPLLLFGLAVEVSLVTGLLPILVSAAVQAAS
jgi:membrane-bound metal-dependent hydrolase YbcI (DUF457 family)